MRRVVICLALVVGGLAFVLGAVLWGGRPDLTEAEQERARIENQALAEKLAVDVAQKEALKEWIVVGKVAAGVLILISVAFGVLVAGAYGLRRTLTIGPDETGLFPLVIGRNAGAWEVRDPNRALAGVTTMGRHPTLPPGLEMAQLRITSQAQVAQLAAAVHRHPPVVISKGATAATPAEVNQPEADTPEPVWPGRIPLTGLLSGSGTSLANVVIGVTVDDTGNHIVTGDMARLVHWGVGGSPGWGKSVFLQSLAYQLATCPERPDLVMVDLDGTTLSPFANCERLVHPLAENERDALALFTVLADELERRKGLYADVEGAVDLATYNARADKPLPATILLCDEATALLGDKGVEAALRVLALRGRKFGVWCVLAGQDWKASSLDTAIRNQLSTRIQFRAMSPSQSRVLLMQRGAEMLPVPGRCLAVLPGREMMEVQAAQVSYSDIVVAMEGQTGPHCAAPMASEEVQVASEHDLTPDQVEEIRELWAQGQSYTAIAEAVFGGKSGRRVEKIRQVIEGADW